MAQKKWFLLLVFAFMITSLIATVSAFSYNSWSYQLSRPSQLLDNEWVVFVGTFLIVFAVVFMALSSIFGKEKVESPRDILWGVEHRGPNKMPVVIISAVIALFVAAAFSQRGYLYGYLGESIGDWALFLASLIIIALLIRMLAVWMGMPGAVLALVGMWFVLQGDFYYDFVPMSIQTPAFEFLYSALTSVIALFILIALLVISAGMAFSSKPHGH